MQNESCDIGLIGLAVMGQNLVLNMNDHGYKVAVFNRTVSKVDDFIKDEAKGTEVVGTHSIEELVAVLKKPRRIMMMVKAGDTVDKMIDSIAPLLDKGDILIDGGNSLSPIPIAALLPWSEGTTFHRHRRIRRRRRRAARSVDHAWRKSAAWPHVKEIFQAIAAKVSDGTPCCDWVGENAQVTM